MLWILAASRRLTSVVRTPSAEPSISGRVGRVVSAVFYGQSVEYRVQTTTGAITAVVPDPDPATIHPVGAHVTVDFEQGRTWLLPAEGHAAYQD